MNVMVDEKYIDEIKVKEIISNWIAIADMPWNYHADKKEHLLELTINED